MSYKGTPASSQIIWLEQRVEPSPKPVGYWIMPGSVSAVTTIKFTAFKRPRWLTRKMMYYVFEWKWEDAK